MKVFVVSITGKPLLPTTPRRARIWLNTRRSRIVNREPFTIQLHFETADYTQPATVGIDTGSQTAGIAATTNGEMVYQAEVHLRTDITGKLTHRRQYRRNRRSRKPRYRATRWANRRRRSGLLLPSLPPFCPSAGSRWKSAVLIRKGGRPRRSQGSPTRRENFKATCCVSICLRSGSENAPLVEQKGFPYR